MGKLLFHMVLYQVEAVKLFHWEVDYFFRKEDYFIADFCSVLKGYVILL